MKVKIGILTVQLPTMVAPETAVVEVVVPAEVVAGWREAERAYLTVAEEMMKYHQIGMAGEEEKQDGRVRTPAA
jgi:hypothetical protein